MHFTQATEQKIILARFAWRFFFFRENISNSRAVSNLQWDDASARALDKSVSAMTDSGWPVPQENLHIANWREGWKKTQHQTHYTSSSSDTMRLMESSNAGSQQSSCRTWYTSAGRMHVWTHPWPDLILFTPISSWIKTVEVLATTE